MTNPLPVPVDDDGVPLGWCMDALLRHALPGVKAHKRTAELAAFAFAEPDEFAVEAAMHRGWCTDAEADRWATVGLLLMPWHVWGDEWWTRGLSELDRLYPLEEWWRPAWEWNEARRAERRSYRRTARRWRARRRRSTAPAGRTIERAAA